VEEFCLSGGLEADHHPYVKVHAERWSFLLRAVDRLVASARERRGSSSLRILDIGEHMQTELLRANHPDVPVDTLDLRDVAGRRRPGDEHHRFDLNDFYYENRRPAIGPYDVIVMAEVIEHLHTAGATVLRGLAGLLRTEGYLFVQTPNAVALHKRVYMLVGRNPYRMELERPRDDPPHFHEYTLRELISAGEAAGLRVVEAEYRNYFSGGTVGSRLYNRIANVLPRSLRTGISVSYQHDPTIDVSSKLAQERPSTVLR
jgi:hypothetical protein